MNSNTGKKNVHGNGERWIKLHHNLNETKVDELRERLVENCISQIKTNRKISIAKARLKCAEADIPSLINDLITSSSFPNCDNFNSAHNMDSDEKYCNKYYYQNSIMNKEDLIEIFGTESYEDMLLQIEYAINDELRDAEALFYNEEENFDDFVDVESHSDMIICPICG